MIKRDPLSIEQVMELRSAFGDAVVTPFVERFQQMKIDPTDFESLHALFTQVYDAGYRDAKPETADAELAQRFRERIAD